MHGRPREYKNKLKDPKAAEAYTKKAPAIKQGTTLVLECRRQHRYDQAALTASEKMLKVVPEIYTIWNYRREALQPIFAAGGEAAAAACAAELALTQACLQENPKSYSTWHHRKWVVAQGLADLAKELKLVGSALALDGRNFHAWNYRQFVVKLMGVHAEEELSYTSSLIAADFSNYSAWHYRTMLLPRLYNEDIATVSFDELMATASEQKQQQQASSTTAASDSAAADDSSQQAAAVALRATGCFTGTASQSRPIPLHVLEQEYEMVHQAFATDSADQSPWIYYRWLLGNSLAHLSQAQQQQQQQGGQQQQQGGEQQLEEARVVLGEVLAREVSRFAEHLAVDPDAKWPLLMTARLKEAQARLGLAEGLGLDSSDLQQQVQELYVRLQQLDPLRAGYYADAAAGKAFVVVQALGTV
uniref:Geranylgeranyl transferase type-2 subunit alpha n=1 Tax=Tetradesmus obliquus TaxID=3088 RepID=A0A383VPP4_TETOB|eukprot:jgi/Sobl393_1/4131/SZX66396.1